MVKFTDPVFQDAYLSSLRKYDEFDVSTSPRHQAKQQQEGRGGQKKYNDDNYNPTSSSRGGANRHNKQQQTSSSDVYVGEEDDEYYNTPILQRSHARQIERESFLKWAGEGLHYTLTDINERNVQDSKKQEIQVRANSKTSERMKKLWDFDDFDDILYDDNNNYEGEEQCRDDDDDIEKYNPTFSHGSEEESESSYDRKHKLWTNSRVRRESRKDITKETLNDLTEMELFTKEMRKRIMQYGCNRVVGDDERNNKEGGGQQKKRGGNMDGEEEKDAGEEEETGIEIELRRLSNTQSSDGEEEPTDDGYGKQVRSSHLRNKTGELIHKFQNTRIKHAPQQHTRDDELIDSSSTPRGDTTIIMSKQKQAVKIATYRGMNQLDDDDQDHNSQERGITSPRDAALQSARLKRTRELKKKMAAQASRDGNNNNNKTTGEEEEDEDGKTDLDRWWDEHKRKQEQRLQRRKEERGGRVGGDTGGNCSDDRLESWWQAQRRSKIQSGVNGTPKKPFAELEEEPTVPEQTPRSPITIGNDSPTTSLKPEPLSPMNTTPQKRMTRQQQQGNVNGNKSTSSSASSTSTPVRPKSSSSSSSHLAPSFRSRHLVSPPSRRGRYGPPCPETPTNRMTPNNIADKEKVGEASSVKGLNNNNGNTNNGEERSPPPSSISVLSEVSNNTSSESRCQSVAQSTLSVLLSRIDEAKSNFTQALVDGDVDKQVELAGLLTRLGEAAVTMKKLEQST